ncbi:MAG: phosphodiester glycosidase family protein [Phocaeicola vulgatus]
MLVAKVDGRAEGHADGMSIAELAYLLRILKAHCALNLDGGGSTTLWVNGQVVNRPSDNRNSTTK